MIKISAPEGLAGDRWGDVAFAEDLAGALRSLGQTVRVDRIDAPPLSRFSRRDDVSIWIRGLATPHLTPHAVNMLWVISHPDLVTEDELSLGWHHIYAASTAWPGQRGERTGCGIQPLLQAVSCERFGPEGESHPHDVLFVGTTRGVERPVVLDAIKVGANVQIYGHGWPEYVDSRYIRADRLLFEKVPAAYRGARRILNDHWDDMRENGFISNRIFDAVASGALVVSDQVEGMEELFGPMVRSYHDYAELVTLLEDDYLWPSTKTRKEIAKQILEHHSFHARAARLLQDAGKCLVDRELVYEGSEDR